MDILEGIYCGSIDVMNLLEGWKTRLGGLDPRDSAWTWVSAFPFT